MSNKFFKRNFDRRVVFCDWLSFEFINCKKKKLIKLVNVISGEILWYCV